jgi:ATPase subunit of ABC transporter with duplicated ATPase domains
MSMDYGNRPVLREVYFRLSAGERVGLIGKNGVGKTTVLKLILGQEQPTEGTREVEPGIRLGYFSQFSEINGQQTVLQVLEEVFAEIHALENALLEVELALDGEPIAGELEQLLRKQAVLIEEMNQKDGWNVGVRIDTVLTRLGFRQAHRACPIDQLSGGWRNRAALAKILLEEPDALLLDEPTNFLDLDGLVWLEEWLCAFRGGLIIVSHDRHFLDRLANRIVEIENYHFQEYQGNFTQYVREKPLRLKTLERQFEHEEELLTLEAEAISDRQEALKNPSRALQRRLANIKKDARPRLVDKIITDIYGGLYVPANLCLVENLAKGYRGASLFHELSFEIHRGDRCAILGPNGCGKSTLLRLLLEEEAPDAGRLLWAKGASYVSFNQVFDELDLNDNVTHTVNIADLAYRAPRRQVNRFLSLMQFSELELAQRIGALSGGQRARVALAKALLSGASAILLDEPTNHLDMTTTQVMERALVHFPGAVLVASHDRFFIDKIATRLLIFDGAGDVRNFYGTWTMSQGLV